MPIGQSVCIDEKLTSGIFPQNRNSLTHRRQIGINSMVSLWLFLTKMTFIWLGIKIHFSALAEI